MKKKLLVCTENGNGIYLKELDAGQMVREQSKIMEYVYIIRIRNITSRPTRTLCEQNEEP